MLTLLIIGLLVLLFIGMPIGFALIFIGSLGILLGEGYSTLQGVLATTAYRSVNSFTYTSIPLFIVMAHFISQSKIADDLFSAILKWVGHKPGGVGVATVAGTAGFGALTGTSMAAVSVMSQIAVPKMIKARYSPSFSTGLVASITGPLACLIPPSIPLIVYGIQTENSIGRLLIAGVVPGLLVALLVSITVIVVGIKQNSRTEKYSWKERWQALATIWPSVLLILLVVAVIYFGIATPTEAASFGAVGALIIGLIMKRLNSRQIIDALLTTAKQTGMIFIIVVGAQLFAYYITMTRAAYNILTSLEALGLSAGLVLFLIIVIYIVLGMFLDPIGSMLLTLPLVYPLIIGLGYDPIWFGVVLVLIVEIGMVTPPVGLNLFLASEYSGVPVQKVLSGSIPFILVLLLCVLILVLFPNIVLWLPTLMM